MRPAQSPARSSPLPGKRTSAARGRGRAGHRSRDADRASDRDWVGALRLRRRDSLPRLSTGRGGDGPRGAGGRSAGRREDRQSGGHRRTWFHAGDVPHCVSKAGVIMLTKGLARALAPDIAVNAVAPGAVLLPEQWYDEARDHIRDTTPLQRLGSPDDVVAGVRFLLAGTDYATGTVLVIDGGRLIR